MAQTARIEQTRPMSCIPTRLGWAARPGRWLARFRAMTQAPARLPAAAKERPGPAVQDPALDGLLPSSRWRRYGWMFAAIWLVYLSQPASTAWAQHDLVRRCLGLGTLIAFSAVFIAVFVVSRRRADRQVPRGIAVAGLATEGALIGFGYYSLGPDASLLLIYLSVMAVFLLPARVGWLVVVAAVGTSLAVPAMVGGWQPDGTLAFQIFVSALAAFGVAQLILRNMQLAEARNEITRLALAEERNRFARDLHDILGHSLTVVAVKAELAGRLTGLDPARAGAEIADVERIARQALADVRAAAGGYRDGDPGRGAGQRPDRAGRRGHRRRPAGPRDQRDAAAPPGAVRLGRPGGGDQRDPAQRRHPLRHPGHPRRGGDHRRRDRPGPVSPRAGRTGQGPGRLAGPARRPVTG